MISLSGACICASKFSLHFRIGSICIGRITGASKPLRGRELHPAQLPQVPSCVIQYFDSKRTRSHCGWRAASQQTARGLIGWQLEWQFAAAAQREPVSMLEPRNQITRDEEAGAVLFKWREPRFKDTQPSIRAAAYDDRPAILSVSLCLSGAQ